MLLEIHKNEIAPGVIHLDVAGRMALGRESQRLEDLTADIAKSGPQKVILDLTKVTYLDSSGIGIIAISSGRLKEAGGKLVVVAPEGRVLQLLKTAGMDAVLSISATVEEAKAAVA